MSQNSQNRKKREETPRQGGKRLAQHPQSEARPEAPRREERRAGTTVQERPAERQQAASASKETGSREQREEMHPLKAMYLAAEHEMTRIRRRWRHLVREKRAKNFPESERLPVQLP